MDQYPDPAASWLLLHGIAALQEEADGAPILDMDALAAVAGLRYSQLARLIATAIHAGWIAEGADGALGLTEAGRRWTATGR